MHTHRIHPLRRHDDKPSKLARSLFFLLVALFLVTAVFGFLRDAEAQMWGYSLPSGTGGYNYFGNQGGGYGDRSGGMLPLGVEMMRLSQQDRLHRRQMAAQYGYPSPVLQRAPRETWTPEKARANWWRTDKWD